MNINAEQLNMTKGNILVRPILEDQTIQAGDIELVKDVQYEDKAFVGEVVSTADDDIDVGQLVFFNKYSSIEFEFGDEDYLVLKVEDILAYIDP